MKAIHHRRNPQQPHPAIRFRYLHPPHRTRLIASLHRDAPGCPASALSDTDAVPPPSSRRCPVRLRSSRPAQRCNRFWRSQYPLPDTALSSLDFPLLVPETARPSGWSLAASPRPPCQQVPFPGFRPSCSSRELLKFLPLPRRSALPVDGRGTMASADSCRLSLTSR